MARTANPACRQTVADLLEAAESDCTTLYQGLNCDTTRMFGGSLGGEGGKPLTLLLI